MSLDIAGDAESFGESKLLRLMRRIPDAEKPKYRQEIERAVFGATVRGGSPRTGSAQNRLRLLAYHEMIAYDTDGVLRGFAKSTFEAVIQLSELFQHTVRFDITRKLVPCYRARWPRLLALQSMESFVARLRAPQDGFKDNQKLDVQIVRKPGATTTFVVFCGLAAKFGQHLNIIHHSCMARLDVNVVYLRDSSHRLYLTGIRSLGTLQESCERLRELIADLNTRKLVCMGNSGGVFAALYYGSLLPADKVVVFSGPASLQIGFEESERQAYQRLHELHATGELEWPDLRAIYVGNNIPVQFHFGRGNRVDRAQAETLAGLPNVKLCPFNTKNHVLIDEMHQTGLFDRVLRAAARDKADRSLFGLEAIRSMIQAIVSRQPSAGR